MDESSKDGRAKSVGMESYRLKMGRQALEVPSMKEHKCQAVLSLGCYLL